MDVAILDDLLRWYKQNHHAPKAWDEDGWLSILIGEYEYILLMREGFFGDEEVSLVIAKCNGFQALGDWLLAEKNKPVPQIYSCIKCGYHFMTIAKSTPVWCKRCWMKNGYESGLVTEKRWQEFLEECRKETHDNLE